MSNTGCGKENFRGEKWREKRRGEELGSCFFKRPDRYPTGSRRAPVATIAAYFFFLGVRMSCV
jgi:hypothetical protein